MGLINSICYVTTRRAAKKAKAYRACINFLLYKEDLVCSHANMMFSSIGSEMGRRQSLEGLSLQ